MYDDNVYEGNCPCCGAVVLYDEETDGQVSACENCGWLDTDTDYDCDPFTELDFND